MSAGGSKGNIGFLCGHLRSKEKLLLDEKRMAILSEVKDFEHLQAAVSGTIFHHALSNSAKDFENISKVESSIGEFVREVLFIGGELIMLASLKEISEGVKLSFLKSKFNSSYKSHLLSCGLFEEELLDPKLAARNIDSFAEEIIDRLLSSIKGAENLYDLDTRLFLAERHILRDRASSYDKTFESFVERILKAEDVWFLYFVTTIERTYFIEICKTEAIREAISEDFRDFFSCLLKSEDVRNLARDVKMKDFELGVFLESVLDAKSPEEARRMAIRYFDKVFARHSLFGVSYIYPFYFFKKLFEQLRIFKASLIRLYGGKSKKQRERSVA